MIFLHIIKILIGEKEGEGELKIILNTQIIINFKQILKSSSYLKMFDASKCINHQRITYDIMMHNNVKLSSF